MKKLFLFLLMAFAAIVPMEVRAQIIDPVKWSVAIQDLNENEFDIVATATIDPEYHIYSTKMPDLGPCCGRGPRPYGCADVLRRHL